MLLTDKTQHTKNTKNMAIIVPFILTDQSTIKNKDRKSENF